MESTYQLHGEKKKKEKTRRREKRKEKTQYTNICTKSTASISHKHFLSGTLNQSIFLNLATGEEIIAIANQFQSSKAAGCDNIPMSIVKQSINFISSSPAHIVNLSIMHGIIPDQMKIARVVPIFKAGDKSNFF